VAFVSGSIYLPVEIYGLAEKVTSLRVFTFVANLVVVIFMGGLLWRSRKLRQQKQVSNGGTPDPLERPHGDTRR